ncbi:MAG TPA: hypothetical protein VIO32_00085 [Candidatus Baltobacteraceae bacterium]
MNAIPDGSAPTVTIQEFSVPQYPSTGVNIAVASDGAVWWESIKNRGQADEADRMVRMQSMSVSVETLDSSDFIGGNTFAATPNGRVFTWGTPAGANSSVDFYYASAGVSPAAGGFYEDHFYTQSLGVLHTGPDGNVWFVAAQHGSVPNQWTLCVKLSADSCSPDSFGYVPQNTTGTSSTVTYTATAPGTQEVLYAIAPGPDNDMWVGGILAPGTNYGFHRYTTGGTFIGDVISTIPYPLGSMADATAGSDGNMWFTDPQQNAIVRLAPNGATTLFPLPTPNANPYAITRGGDGAVWFTERNSNKVGRISTSGQLTEYALPTTMNSNPGQIAGPSSPGCDANALWVSQPGTGQIAELTIKI